MESSKVGLFIVGEAKSGTHALFYLLGQHPEICPCAMKEPLFFCTDLWQESDQFHKDHGLFTKDYYPFRTIEQYHELWEDCPKGAFRGEASVRYAYSKKAANNIASYNSDARIIYLIREPVDFVYSYHSEALMGGSEIQDFAKAIELEKLRKQGKQVPVRVANPSELFYGERVKYADHLQRYLNVFPREQIHVVVYDDFKADNLAVYERIRQWLGLSAFTPKVKVLHTNRRPRIRWVFNAITSPRFWKIPKMIIPRGIYRPIADAILWLVAKTLIVYKKRAPMDPSLRTKLMRRYKPEVERISVCIDRDLVTEWGYKDI